MKHQFLIKLKTNIQTNKGLGHEISLGNSTNSLPTLEIQKSTLVYSKSWWSSNKGISVSHQLLFLRMKTETRKAMWLAQAMQLMTTRPGQTKRLFTHGPLSSPPCSPPSSQASVTSWRLRGKVLKLEQGDVIDPNGQISHRAWESSCSSCAIWRSWACCQLVPMLVAT